MTANQINFWWIQASSKPRGKKYVVTFQKAVPGLRPIGANKKWDYIFFQNYKNYTYEKHQMNYAALLEANEYNI